MERKKIKLSFIISCYNCEKSIKKLINDIIETVSSENEKNSSDALNLVSNNVEYQYEIVCTNDASIDGTLNILIEYAKKNINIKVISLVENVGQHIAIIVGMRNVSGDIIINLDDDLQTDPKQCFNLINKLNDNYDIVFAKYKKKKENLVKRIGSHIHKIIFHILHKTKGFYINSYFVCTKDVAKEIGEYRAFFEAISSKKFLKNKKITNVLVEHKDRGFGKSTYNLLKLARLFFHSIFTSLGIRIKDVKEYKIDKIYN